VKIKYTRNNILRGALVYASGDTIAAWILQELMISRLLGIMLVGATFYAFEIPAYFAWIEKKALNVSRNKRFALKTGLAILYFNPLWIARHLVFIQLFSGNFHPDWLSVLRIASWSFVVNIPISLTANFIIQNKIPLRWRFLASAVFSGLMAVFYAVSKVLF
jgi:hypothetical protein